MPPPSADRPIASAAPRPSHLSRSARVASIACAKAGFADRKTATAVPKVAMGANNLDMRRIERLLVGVGFVLGREISGDSIRLLVVSSARLLVLFVRDGLADVHRGQQREH